MAGQRSLGSLIGLVLSAAIGTFAVYVSTYMYCFILSIHVPYLVPTTVDGGLDSPNPPYLLRSPLWNNLVLLLGFGLQHSGMLRGPSKRVARLVLSEDGYRVFYVAVASLYLMCVMYLWTPLPYKIWEIKYEPLRFVLLGAGSLSFGFVGLSLLNLDPFTLVGVRPYFDQVFNREKPEPNFVTTGLYGLMRHPTYSFLMLGFWTTPTMTMGHLLLAVIFTGYILFAVAMYEEPELVKLIGPRYEEYQRTTPQYIPTWSSFAAAMGRQPSTTALGRQPAADTHKTQ